jgi:hypothetical protein
MTFIGIEEFRGVVTVGAPVGIVVGERVLGVGLIGGVGLVGRREVGFFVGSAVLGRSVGGAMGARVVGNFVMGNAVGRKTIGEEVGDATQPTTRLESLPLILHEGESNVSLENAQLRHNGSQFTLVISVVET